MTYIVTISNLGIVYHGEDEGEAEEKFSEYKNIVGDMFYGETVKLMCDNVTKKEFTGEFKCLREMC